MSIASTTEQYREQIWAELSKVARPDSRFHWDFSSFICDFEGSEKCSDQVLELVAASDRGDRQIFVTPDNCLEDLRYKFIQQGIPFVMTTYGIARGFYRLDPSMIPVSDHRYAATLDGFDRYAEHLSLHQLQKTQKFSLLVTGGSAVSKNGVRFGKGHGYFDFEWAVLSELGLTDNSSVVADVVHDCQFVNEVMPAERHDVVVDWVITPTRKIHIDQSSRQRGRVFWEMVPGTEFAELGIVAELRDIQNLGPL
ncbi:MAG: 5-formyltetrahydrofolate cyclo-ligase [Ilumatobacteraceae bacterium]|nr:5-formyltetrahydrofolate cyclo-ligase [Ilumatobacteraceae bacterium]